MGDKNEVSISGDKEESRTIRWLQKATSKDVGRYRGGLTGIYITGDAAVACDGHRLHAIRTPEPLEGHEGKILVGDVRAGDFNTMMTDLASGKDEARYPDVGVVIGPDEDSKLICEFAVNPRYLRDAVQGLDDPVRIRVYGPNEPVHLMGKDRQGNDAYVVIMPMHMGGDEGLWKPKVQDD